MKTEKNIRHFFKIVLYGNIYIALCAFTLSLQTFLIFESELKSETLTLIFFATLAVYSLHRIVGLSKIHRAQFDERFIIIYQQQKYLKFFLGIGALASIASFFFLSNPAKYFLLLISLPSLAYTIPFYRGKRLRDFAYLKIFIVAIVWSLTTVALPFVELGLNPNFKFYLLLLDRTIFIFAITVPFDIRDAEIEKSLSVKTLTSLLGEKMSVYLSIFLLILRLPLILLIYPYQVGLALIVILLISVFLVWGAQKAKNDFYFTGLLDGTMLLEGLTVSVLMFIR